MEQILISAYTLDNLLNARREIAVGNVAGFTGRIDNVISIFEGVAEDELLNLMGRDKMGTWGTGLYSNDSACDIRGDYIDKLKRGKNKR